jgi:hypothetical protein
MKPPAMMLWREMERIAMDKGAVGVIATAALGTNMHSLMYGKKSYSRTHSVYMRVFQ